MAELALDDPRLETETGTDSEWGETMALWQLYLLAVSSLCLYLPIWVYRRAKLNGEGSELQSTPVWWGFGTLVAPVCCAILYDFSGKAAAASGERHGRLWRVFPSLLFVTLASILFLLPAGSLMVAPLFLLPVPFLIVQRRINAPYTQVLEPTEIQPVRLGVRHWILIVIGLPAVLFFWWSVELPTYSIWATSPFAENAVLSGASGLYELTTPSRSWKRVRTGTFSWDETDLELKGPGLDTQVIVFRWDNPAMGLDGVIDVRRQVLFELGDPMALDEERFFLEGSDLAPASLAHYRVYWAMDANDYLVLTVQLESGLVEVIGNTSESDDYLGELRELLMSFTPTKTGGEP